MDSRSSEVFYRPPYPTIPIPAHSLSLLPPTLPLSSFPTTTDVPIVENHPISVPPPYSSSYAGDESASKACAACRFRRQKCKGDCLLAPFFPATEEARFQKALRLFGVIRMQKTLESLLPDQRAVAMATMIYESEVRAARPATGCLDIILQLHSQIERKAAHLAQLRQHLSILPFPTPTLDTTVVTKDGEITPPTLQSGDTNLIATGNLKRRYQDLPEEVEEEEKETMRQSRRRRTSQ